MEESHAQQHLTHTTSATLLELDRGRAETCRLAGPIHGAEGYRQAAEEQAIARAHRIGQQQPVFVYRFVSENTLEQQILDLQERKQTLIDSVMPFLKFDKKS